MGLWRGEGDGHVYTGCQCCYVDDDSHGSDDDYMVDNNEDDDGDDEDDNSGGLFMAQVEVLVVVSRMRSLRNLG